MPYGETPAISTPLIRPPVISTPVMIDAVPSTELVEYLQSCGEQYSDAWSACSEHPSAYDSVN